ncbi:hypothetical protein ACHAXM_008204 [Skeletonema potamos]|jgi:hypothetical protein
MQHKDEIINQLQAMLAKEADEPATHLHNYFTKDVDEECRKKIVDWYFKVVGVLNISTECVWRATNLLDRYLCSGKGLSVKAVSDRRLFQLASMVSLYMAIKVYEGKTMTISSLELICRNHYTTSEFVSMEHDILFALNWTLAATTTPMDFVRYALLLQSDLIDPSAMASILAVAQEQMDLTISDVYFASYKRSSVGLACLGAAFVESDISPALQKEFWFRLSSELNLYIPSRQVVSVYDESSSCELLRLVMRMRLIAPAA